MTTTIWNALAALLDRRGLWRAALLLLLLVISVLALSPSPPRMLDSGWDKLNHLAAFVALAVAASLSAQATPSHALRCAIGLLSYGALIEILQSQLPPREGDWADLLADALGIVSGLVLSALLRRIATRNA
jgi:VanZ family protein